MDEVLEPLSGRRADLGLHVDEAGLLRPGAVPGTRALPRLSPPSSPPPFPCPSQTSPHPRIPSLRRRRGEKTSRFWMFSQKEQKRLK